MNLFFKHAGPLNGWTQLNRKSDNGEMCCLTQQKQIHSL